MNIKIGDLYKGYVIDFTHEGNGVIKIDNFPIFIEDVIVGDYVEFKVIDNKKSYALGEALNILEYSNDREQYHFNSDSLGGGVPLLNYKYEKQLQWKEKKVEQDIQRIGGITIKAEPIIGMKYPFRYRNHTQIPVGKVKEKAVTGYYKKKTNTIVPLEEDYLQPEIADTILKTIRDWIDEYNIPVYNRYEKTGVIKHIGIRTNENNEAMLIIVTAFSMVPNKYELIHRLVKECPGIVSIYQNINQMDGKFTYGREYIHLFGQEYLRDYIGNLQFDISPQSFFQVNRIQTKVLYEKAREYLQPNSEDIVFDIYSGIGTISMFISDSVKKVIGIESVESAVEDARINAKKNNISNAEFKLGKAENLIFELITEFKANKVILDPPRKGCEKEVLEELLKLKPERIVYISCNPSTLARDIKILTKDYYKVTKVQPVDMFPHTAHVETVVLMSCKDN